MFNVIMNKRPIFLPPNVERVRSKWEHVAAAALAMESSYSSSWKHDFLKGEKQAMNQQQNMFRKTIPSKN
jgi:hypothetical protein